MELQLLATPTSQGAGWSLQEQLAHCWTEVEQFQGTREGVLLSNNRVGVVALPSSHSELLPLTYLMVSE